MKLISVERQLEIFSRKNDRLVIDIPINLSLEILKQIVKYKKRDDLLYDQYKLSKYQVTRLIKEADLDLQIELKTNTYYLGCVGNYEY